MGINGDIISLNAMDNLIKIEYPEIQLNVLKHSNVQWFIKVRDVCHIIRNLSCHWCISSLAYFVRGTLVDSFLPSIIPRTFIVTETYYVDKVINRTVNTDNDYHNV